MQTTTPGDCLGARPLHTQRQPRRRSWKAETSALTYPHHVPMITACIVVVGSIAGRDRSAALTFVPKRCYGADMEPETSSPAEVPVNLANALGADAGVAVQCFTVYIPNKDKNDQEIGTQRRWVLDAIRLLSEINGGATAIPVEGGWLNDEGAIILEHPVVVYSFVSRPVEFLQQLPRLRAFLHRLGRETNQGEVAFEFDDRFYRIRQFDTA
jgi:hypothetical protein